MAVPLADQIRLSHILADDLQPRIQWAYDLEQQVLTLSGGGLTSWGLASQAQFHGNGDPNGVVTAIAEGDLYVDETGTPGLWIANGAGTVWTELGSGGGGGAPTTADYLVGTADAGLSNEIVVGPTPGGELGNTWASPTVDTIHSGSSHAATAAAAQAAAEATAANANNLTSGTVAIARLPLDADLATLSLPASTTITTFGASLVDDANAAAALATLGLDADLATFALPASTTISAFGASLIDDAAASNARTTLGLGTIATQDANNVTISGGSVTGITDLAIADGGTAASNAAGALANFSGQAGADFSLNSHKLTAVSDGTAVDDVATFGQVTNLINGRPVKLECRAATTTALPTVIYANGSSGVGATLTGASVGALSAQDGVTLGVGDRFLVKNQVAQEQDGAYTVTAIGSGIAVFILTRATDSDQAADLQNGASYYIVLGTTLADTTWALSNDPQTTIVMGTTALTFAQVDGAGSTAAGNGLSRAGNTLSIDTAITVDKTTAQTLTNKTLTSPVVNTGVSGTAVDTDSTMAANSDTLLASQKAIKTALATKQAADADLTTYAGITPGALGQAILPMTTLTNHGLVVGAGASAPTALAPDAGTTKFLKNSVASDAPTWQAVAESDVTNLVTDLTDLQTQTTLQAAQMQATVLADAGQFVYSGCLLSPNATPTKLDMTAGVSFQATTELVSAAKTAISTTIASMADATNPKWVIVELDSSNVMQFNQGTAAAAPAFPTFTTTRTPLGFLFIPANATNVDTLLTTVNGLAKLIDARVIRTIHFARLFATDTTQTQLTNPTAFTSILNATITIPANSLSVGDKFRIRASGNYLNNTTARTMGIQALVGAVAVLSQTTTASLPTSATARPWIMDLEVAVLSIGASGKILATGRYAIGGATAAIATEIDAGIAFQSAGGATLDTTAASSFDLKVRCNTGDAAMTMRLLTYWIEKQPA